MKYAKNLMKQSWASDCFFIFFDQLINISYYFISEMIPLSRKIKLMAGILYVHKTKNK